MIETDKSKAFVKKKNNDAFTQNEITLNVAHRHPPFHHKKVVHCNILLLFNATST